jgi:hypothetical protein
MAIQRPGRPTTRVPNVPPKGAPQKPTTRAGTGPVPRQSAPPPAPTGRARSSGSSTRSVAKQGGSRPVPKTAAPKSNTTMMIAIGAGVVVVLGIAAFAMSGDSKKPETSAPKATSKSKAPIDVRGLETEGMKKCDQGLAIIKRCAPQMSSTSLSDSEKTRLKSDLEQGTGLIKDGMAMLDEAYRKSGNTYPVTEYNEAKKAARMKLGELGGN